MSALLQIWTYQVTATEWTPLCCPLGGSCLKAWITYGADVHFRSDPNNPATDYLVQFSQGNQFSFPFVGPVTMDGTRPLVFAQAASGTVSVTVFCIMQ